MQRNFLLLRLLSYIPALRSVCFLLPSTGLSTFQGLLSDFSSRSLKASLAYFRILCHSSCFIPGIRTFFLPSSTSFFSLNPWLSISNLYLWVYSMFLATISSAGFFRLLPKSINLSPFDLIINRKLLEIIGFISFFLSPPRSITYLWHNCLPYQWPLISVYSRSQTHRHWENIIYCITAISAHHIRQPLLLLIHDSH